MRFTGVVPNSLTGVARNLDEALSVALASDWRGPFYVWLSHRDPLRLDAVGRDQGAQPFQLGLHLLPALV